MGIKDILKKLYPSKDFSKEDNMKFNKIPEDYELAHYNEKFRREEVIRQVQQLRRQNGMLSPSTKFANIHETKYQGHSLFNQDGDIIPDRNAKTEFNKIVQEGSYTPEEKLLYSQNNNPKPIKKGKNVIYKSSKTNIKDLSKSQIKKLLNQLKKSRKVQLRQIKGRQKVAQRLTSLVQARGLQRIRPASGVSQDIGKPIINDTSIMKSEVIFREVQPTVPLFDNTGYFNSHSQVSQNKNSMFWKY